MHPGSRRAAAGPAPSPRSAESRSEQRGPADGNLVPAPGPGRPAGEMSFFGFGQSVEVDILLNDAESRKRAEHKTEDGKKEKYFLFYDGETVSGKVSLALKNPNKRLEHQGIKVEFIGQIGEWLAAGTAPAHAVRGPGDSARRRRPGGDVGARPRLGARRCPLGTNTCVLGLA